MTTCELCIIRNPSDNWDFSRPYSNVDSGKLFQSANNSTLQLPLRETVMYELALRGDRRVLDICEELVKSDDLDAWLLGLRTMSILGSDTAMNRLIEMYMNADIKGRKLALDIIAANVSADFAQPFSLMVREFLDVGTLDVSSWTSVAVATLYHVCKRNGILVKFFGDPNYHPSITGFPLQSDISHESEFSYEEEKRKTRIFQLARES